jgi:integrase
VIRIRQGKGGKDREVPLSPKLLDQLRTYYRFLKRKNGWLFPSLQMRRRDQPITNKAVWHVCREASRRAGITKAIRPHTLRHASAYYTTFQSTFILKVIALGQAQSAAVYGRNRLLAPVPAQLGDPGPFDR